jgi:thioredoxin 1
MGPVLDSLAAELGDGARIVKLDVDESPEVAERFGIRSIPTMMIFNAGERKKTFIGLTSRGRLAKFLARFSN